MAAFLVGMAKTSIGGLAVVSVALYALVLPTRESTAALLLVLVVGDLVAVAYYRRDADWALIRTLLPGVLPGLVVGSALLAVVSDAALQAGLGVLLLTLVALQLLLERRGSTVRGPWPVPARLGAGLAAGVTTMVANAAGAVMALYLVSEGVEKRRFVGTAAWFFLGVNLTKLPFSAGLGLMSPGKLVAAALLAPVVLLGAACGVRLLRALRQRTFETLVLLAAGASAVPLLTVA